VTNFLGGRNFKNKQIVFFANLDNIAGASFPHYDPYFVGLESTIENDELSSPRRTKEIVNMALKYWKSFQLDVLMIKNCAFVRQMKEFIHAFNTHNNSESNKKHEGFIQKTFHIMTVGKARFRPQSCPTCAVMEPRRTRTL
jgi:hypothetical protein